MCVDISDVTRPAISAHCDQQEKAMKAVGAGGIGGPGPGSGSVTGGHSYYGVTQLVINNLVLGLSLVLVTNNISDSIYVCFPFFTENGEI